MKRALLISIVFILFSTGLARAGQVIIRGNNPGYAGQTLQLCTYLNKITGDELVLSASKVDSLGNFEWRFDESYTQYVFVHAGVFFVFIYAEPDMEYTVKLPPRTDKTMADKLNPYFDEVKLGILISDFKALGNQPVPDRQHEINFLIRTLDDYFNPFITKYSMRVYTNEDPASMDSAMIKMEQTFGGIDNPYFRNYYFYRLGLLKFTSTRFKSRNISQNYFLHKPVLYDNPAYMELFNRVYDKYFVYFGRSKEGSKIYDDINRDHSLSELENTLRLNGDLSNDTLLEFVILKSVHDGFYEMEFSRSALLQVLDSLVASTKIPEHRDIGLDIRQKVTKLLTGYKPPEFHLYDQDSILRSLNDYKGKFVYLFFCTTQNYACLKQYDYLAQIARKFSKYVEVVTISADDNFGSMQNFIKKSGYSWTFLNYGNQPGILKDYDIRTFPTCYLIDNEGKLIVSPAPLPTENLEITLFDLLRARKIL